MPEGNKKFIEDAARVIDGRVALLEAELAKDEARNPTPHHLASDRAAIAEAKHCAKLIRKLALAAYRGDPHQVAQRRLATGFQTGD